MSTSWWRYQPVREVCPISFTASLLAKIHQWLVVAGELVWIGLYIKDLESGFYNIVFWNGLCHEYVDVYFFKICLGFKSLILITNLLSTHHQSMSLVLLWIDHQLCDPKVLGPFSWEKRLKKPDFYVWTIYGKYAQIAPTEYTESLP